MPMLDAESGAGHRPSVRVWFRIGLALLAIALSPFAYRGWNDWREDVRLRDTSLAFMRDVAAGRKDLALRYLANDYRRQVEQDWKAEFDRVWEATGDLSLRVMSVARRDNTAEVRVSVAKSGFAIHPLLHLQRIGRNDWKITRIDDVDVDPRWKRYREQEAEEAATAIADDLAQKLDAE